MTTYTITDALLNSPEAAAHFSTADTRVLRGIRAALEMLEIPLPEYAQRKPAGRPCASALRKRFGSGPKIGTNYTMPRPASPERVAAAKARSAARLAAHAGR